MSERSELVRSRLAIMNVSSGRGRMYIIMTLVLSGSVTRGFGLKDSGTRRQRHKKIKRQKGQDNTKSPSHLADDIGKECQAKAFGFRR